MITTSPTQVDTRAGRSAKIIDALVLMMLGAFAVAQPILSDFRAGAGYFVARRNEPLEILLLVVVLIIVPGALANLVVWAADGFTEKARANTQTVFVGVFVALISQTALVRLSSINWPVLAVGSLLVGAVASRAYGRSNWFRTFLMYLIPAPVVFAMFFLFTPPVARYVFPSDPDTFETGRASATPVVFVVFDELPVVSLLDESGGIDTTRFPNFAALASISTWYKHTASAHESTLWAVPALLTGRTPEISSLPTAADHPGNLFTLLNPSHQLHVVEPFTHLCPPELCGQFPASSLAERSRTLLSDTGELYQMMLTPDSASSVSVSDPFNEFDPATASQAVERESFVDQLDRFDEFLEDIGSSDSVLHFIHVFLPHAPFRYYPSSVQYNDAGELAGHDDELWVEPALANQGYQRHLMQVGMVDGLIGDLVSRLAQAGILDESVLVVTADHGVSFQPGQPRRPLVEANAFDIGLVPLFIKGPHQEEGAIDLRPSRAIDVLPTVASYLGLELPWEHDGRSLLAVVEDALPLTVKAGDGSDVPLDDVERGLRSAVSRKTSLFGVTNGTLDLYSFGGYDSLIGSASSGLPANSLDLRAEVDESWRLAHVAPYTGFVPGFIHGRLRGEVEAAPYVAIAVNGVVRSVVETYAVVSDRASFSAILPDSAFVAGFNELDILAVSGPSVAPVVHGVDLEGQPRFEMERADNGRVTRLVDLEGDSWRLEERSPMFGFVDDAEWPESGLPGGGTDLYLAGWAIDQIDEEPVERVVVFVNDVFAGSAEVDRERSDIEESYENDDVLVSGFVARLSQFLPTANMEVRVFALSNGLAEELQITDKALADIAAG